MDIKTTVILFRHGSYEEQSLDEEGRKQASEACSSLSAQGFIPTIILSSPVDRAMETAKVAEEMFHAPLYPAYDLADYNPDKLLSMIQDGECTLMVGHAPSLAEFANLLLGRQEVQKLDKGQFCIITFTEEPGFGRGTLVK